MRRRYTKDPLYWHCRYTGIPENSKLPVTIRKTIDSTIYSTNMMEFVKTLGLRSHNLIFFYLSFFRMEYEYIASGYLFTKENIRVIYSVFS